MFFQSINQDIIIHFYEDGVEYKYIEKATDWFPSDQDKLDKGGNKDEKLNKAMKDVDIKGTALDLDKNVDEDKVKKYVYDDIKEIKNTPFTMPLEPDLVNWTRFKDVAEAITTEEKWKVYIQDLHKSTLAFGGFSIMLDTRQLNPTLSILDYTNEMSASILVIAVALATYVLVTSAYCYLRLGQLTHRNI
ncbi:hypothetical protein C8R48DRAFT_679270 [Suillus tomentosus]|nr:hypothetical protein C8R48DRAFT_679270 [Suillus tomentosus]